MSYRCGISFPLGSKSKRQNNMQSSYGAPPTGSQNVSSCVSPESTRSFCARLTRRFRSSPSLPDPLQAYIPSPTDKVACGCGMGFRVRSVAKTTPMVVDAYPFEDQQSCTIRDLSTVNSPTSAQSLLYRTRYRKTPYPPSTPLRHRRSL